MPSGSRPTRGLHYCSSGRIGYGSPKKQGQLLGHGDPLGEDELQATKKALGWPTMDKFYLPQDAVDFFRQAIPRGAQAEDEWDKKFSAYKKDFPAEAAEFELMVSGRLPENWSADLPKWKPTDKPMATRAAGGGPQRAGQAFQLIGGSADLSHPKNRPTRFGDFQSPDWQDRAR
jgi:transketolase